VVGAIRSARSIGRPGIASLVVVQPLVASAAEHDEVRELVRSALAERDHVVDLGAVAVLAELADEPRADQRFAADLG
jgi:hypothetical protein